MPASAQTEPYAELRELSPGKARSTDAERLSKCLQPAHRSFRFSSRMRRPTVRHLPSCDQYPPNT
jgi:hypothetical protein